MFDPVTLKLNVDPLILSALKEDITSEDVSANSIIKTNQLGKVDLICKQDGIICGLQVFERAFTLLDDKTKVDFFAQDGDQVKNGQLLAKVTGDVRVLLCAERTALNYLQRMSGIATLTNKFVKEIEHTDAKLLDTRKTTPNLKILEKYAVKVGGGHNHRFNLSDGVMLKDNHIDAAGGITNAVNLARKNSSFVRKIEVETETLDMVKEALEVKADIIMLDNMDLDTAKKAVSIIGNKAQIEFSGNVSLETIKSIAEIGVGFISVGALTHSSKILDLSMKNLKPLN